MAAGRDDGRETGTQPSTARARTMVKARATFTPGPCLELVRAREIACQTSDRLEVEKNNRCRRGTRMAKKSGPSLDTVILKSGKNIATTKLVGEAWLPRWVNSNIHTVLTKLHEPTFVHQHKHMQYESHSPVKHSWWRSSSMIAERSFRNPQRSRNEKHYQHCFEQFVIRIAF